jgi:translation initiation factor IF-3
VSAGGFSRGGPGDKQRVRANERIRVPQVRVIDAEGEQVGIMDTRDALALAREKGLDLVEVSPTARPPVCRVMDFGKYKYEEAKKQRAAKRKQHSFQIKEVKLRPKIEDHDYTFKMAAARKFLEQHHKVKLTIMFRGREMAHPELGERLLQRVIQDIGDSGIVEHTPRLEGRFLTTVVAPRPARGGVKPRRDSEEPRREGEGEGEESTAEPASATPPAAQETQGSAQ